MFECLAYIPDMSRQDSERHLLAAAALQSPGDKHQPCAQAVAPPDMPEAEVLKEAIFVPQEVIKPLNDCVEIIRAAAKFEPLDSLKFADKTRPPKISKSLSENIRRDYKVFAA